MNGKWTYDDRQIRKDWESLMLLIYKIEHTPVDLKADPLKFYEVCIKSKTCTICADKETLIFHTADTKLDAVYEVMKKFFRGSNQ